MNRDMLKTRIEAIFETRESAAPPDFVELFAAFIDGLNRGAIRSAEPVSGGWQVNEWVKKGILLGFRYGRLTEYTGNGALPFFDKDTYPLRPAGLSDGVRIVPGGTSVRTGAFVAEGVVIMPPAYINVGAFVGKGSMVDSHALIGSCAQIGERVHVSAAAQVGGVLEPVGALPVIIEDDVLIGGNVGIYEGTQVRRRAVIGAGTILTGSVPIYDLVNETVIRKEAGRTLVVPENAVVVPGSRPLRSSAFARENELNVACAVIVKYRDERTAAATALEDALR